MPSLLFSNELFVMSWYTEYKRSLKMVEIEEVFDLIFYRPLAFILVKIIYRTKVTPNQLTLIAISFGLAAACIYATGKPFSGLYGALVFMMYNIIDCSDGQMARLKKNGTRAGRIVDGTADYIATGAVLIGVAIGQGGANMYSHERWYLLLFAVGCSFAIQSVLVDYYRNRFLDYVWQRKSTFGEEMEAYREEYKQIKHQKGKWFDTWVLNVYFKYSAFQNSLIAKKANEKAFKATSDEYYRKNKLAVRVWVTIGPTMQITTLMICSAINRYDIFFLIIIGIFNAIAGIMWLVQKNIDATFKMGIVL